jgi:hypothetical protein
LCLDRRDPPGLRRWVLALVLVPFDHALLIHPRQWARQQTPWFERHSIPATYDEPTNRSFPQSRYTPGA